MQRAKPGAERLSPQRIGARDPDKKLSWPVYLVAVRAKERCPACVLVVAPDADVATWAAEPIDLGLGRDAVEPRAAALRPQC
jgi:hypothetical protein